jgi:dockerin type I repeat protein
MAITASSGTITNSTSFAINVLKPLQQRGDVNGDCNTNIFDMAIVSGNFGKRVTTGINPRADLNLDGEINVIDLAMVASNIGRTCM